MRAFFRQKKFVDDGRLQEGKDLCERVMQTYGADSRILNLMGVIHYRGGDPNKAIGYFKQLLDTDPTNVEALFNLANLLSNLGYREQAIEMYESILTHAPEHIQSLKELNRLCFLEGKMDMSFLAGARLVKLSPSHDDTWNFMLRALSQVSPRLLNDNFINIMMSTLDNPASNWRPAIRLSLYAIGVNHPTMSACLHIIQTQGVEGLADITLEQLCQIPDIPILHAMLRRYAIPHPALEILLTLARSRLLLAPEGESLEPYMRVLLSLAFQGYVNEYAYYRTDEEEARVAALQKEIESQPLEPNAATISKILLLGSYVPLFSLPLAGQLEALAKKYNDPDFSHFVKVTVSEVLEEREIAKTIPVLAMGDDATSVAVREQYEESPYPRWIGLGDTPAETTSQILRRLFPLFDQTQIEMSDAPEILVAGCGTGKHGVGVARRFRNSHVTAVDLSRASLAYAIRKTREYKIKNVKYYQADILRLGELNRTFDNVESAGVLHHMRDPMEGWRVLVSLLKPGGLMKIGLYSSKAREAITAMRQEIREKGYGDSVQEIRRFRHEMMLDPHMQEKYSFTIANDFYSLSECRDLLFHRQEHCTNLLELKERLEVLGLKFMGFEMTNLEILEEYIQRFPDDPYWNNLEHWHALEQDRPLTFFGMYQFWCYKPL